jgi:hypothetical protein
MVKQPGVQKKSASDVLSRDRAIEQWAKIQIDQLIDPDTPHEEREWRIHRLTEGPPEFVELRLDLPRNKMDN